MPNEPKRTKISIYDGDVLDRNNLCSDASIAVNSCGIHVDTYMRTVRRCGRVDYQLIYVESGSLEVILEDRTETLTAGGFVLYRPGEPQNYVQKTGVCYWVHFTGSAAEELLRSAALDRSMLFQNRKHEPAVSHAFEKMIFHSAQRTALRALSIAADLICIIAEIAKLAHADLFLCNDDRLRHIIIQMNQNYSKNIDLDSYAAAAGLSRSRFLHLFKESTGQSPHAFLLNLRLSRAAELLLSTNDTVSQIAFAVGFSDPFYFSRLFKKHFSLSPDAFRRK